ncbi:MAG: PEP/pyruvate-binding domain-containing protein, partial [Planctomycetota bacterium]
MAFILPFSSIRLADLPQVGGKNSSLGEMVNALSGLGVKVPNGFAVTADAYRHFLKENDLGSRIDQAIADLDPTKLDRLEATGSLIRQWIRSAEMPEDLKQEIRAAYNEREKEYGTNYDVAVRSSATAEDLPDASFAGQQETFLNVRTSTELIEKVRRVYASLYTNRAISYRAHTGYGVDDIAIS